MAPVVRLAELADVATLSSLWRIGAERQQQVGAPSWSQDMISQASARIHIQSGEARLILRDGTPVAAFLLQEKDATFWDDRRQDEALYLHRIAVIPEAAGGQVTRALTDWAAAEALRRNRHRLRLDCAPLPKLVDVYVRLGFTVVDRCIKSGWDVVRFERRLDLI